MAKSRTNRPSSPLMVRLDEDSKAALTRAAELRRISVSDYVRQVTVAQARKEVAAAAGQTIESSPPSQACIVAVSSQSCSTRTTSTKTSMP